MYWGKRKSKYGIRTDADGKARRTLDGILFASEGEMHRYKELKLHRDIGRITCLDRQKPFPLIVNGEKIAIYRSDFTYHDRLPNGDLDPLLTIEDFKGKETPEFKIKWKLLQALYGATYRYLLTGARYGSNKQR